MKLTLIRHGITEGNKRNLVYGSTDLPLLPEGIEELNKLRKEFIYPGTDLFYTSKLIRTQQTLKALYGQVPYKIIDGIEEMNFGRFEMKTSKDVENESDFLHWFYDWDDSVGPGGESWQDIGIRAKNALRPIILNGRDAVCVTHGGIIATLMITWFTHGEDKFEYLVNPGYGYTIRFDGETPLSYEKIPFEQQG